MGARGLLPGIKVGDAGYANADSMAQDSDLESLHGDPEFEAIVAEVKKRAAEQ